MTLSIPEKHCYLFRKSYHPVFVQCSFFLSSLVLISYFCDRIVVKCHSWQLSPACSWLGGGMVSFCTIGGSVETLSLSIKIQLKRHFTWLRETLKWYKYSWVKLFTNDLMITQEQDHQRRNVWCLKPDMQPNVEQVCEKAEFLFLVFYHRLPKMAETHKTSSNSGLLWRLKENNNVECLQCCAYDSQTVYSS